MTLTKPRFEPTINLGHILTFVGFLVTGVVTFQGLDKRVAVIEQAQTYQVQRDAAQDRANDQTRTETKDALNDVHRSLEKLSDKLDAIKR